MSKVFLLLVLMLFLMTALFAVTMPSNSRAALAPVPDLTGTHPDKAWFRKDVLEAPGTVMVFFTAPWCGYCKEMEPGLKLLVKEHPENLKLVKVDGAVEPDLTLYYRADYVPFLLVFVDGQPVGSVQGKVPLKDLEEMLEPYLKGKQAKAA